jgi:hypothetical protein
MPSQGQRLLSTLLGLVGAAAGGAVGFFGCRWMASSGLYAIVLPTALVGAGCGLLARHDSLIRGVVCGLAGFSLGLFAEWYNFPFVKDDSFRFFLAHVGDLPPTHLGLMAVGAVLSFYLGKGTFTGPWGERGHPRGEARA